MFIALTIGGYNTFEKSLLQYIKICVKDVGKYNNSYMLVSYNPFILYDLCIPASLSGVTVHMGSH